MIGVTVDEKILRPPEKSQVIHEYGEPLKAVVQVIPLKR